MSNSKELQAMINCKEQVMCESTATEESYAQSTLGGSNREKKGVHRYSALFGMLTQMNLYLMCSLLLVKL